MENYSLIIDDINQSSQRGSAILFDLYNRVKFDGYHELLRRGVYMKVMTWWVVYDNCRNWENSQRLAKYPNTFRDCVDCVLQSTRLHYMLYIYAWKIRSQALTCFMVAERRANKSLPRVACRASQWRRGGVLLSSNTLFRGYTSVHG